MKVLALETSSKRFSLATGDGQQIVKSRTMVLNKILSDSIIPAIDRILTDSKLTLAKLDALVIGLGPGSFTSLRVGMATVKGLAFAANKPVIGITSLDAIAFNVGQTDQQICVLCDARRNLVYACLYENVKGKLKRKSEYLLTPLSALLARIQTKTIFVGDAVALYQADIEKYSVASDQKIIVNFAASTKSYPSAKNLMALAQEPLKKKKFADLNKLVPLYLYPEDCQVQR
ncbi:MAG: tRNA (adenosine(37)-N6)-threonylcarbamoyltransferase complex dimerization subunit type 1 TsaB [Candidatus Omnitrophica bacterium]|nr:tRNA (adenosine(37)-N6)-threonylcarbamoyltransferase complex dimerization subunit type 1 TsaB [Candidatus Omnitrophota bacterium]